MGSLDFIRKHKTEILIEIDEHKREADNFPFPLTKELQWRYYTRYSMDCLMVELAKSEDGDTHGKFYVMADPSMGAVEGIYTYRQNEYGALLLEKAKEDTKQGGFCNLYLCSDHVGYYEKYGFSKIGTGYHPWGESSGIFKIAL